VSATALVALYKARGLRLATAESCTGGLVAAAITDIAGSSAVFTHGFVTYANEAKTQMLGVPEQMLAAHGAVSPEVAAAMASGARAKAGADIAVSTTGIAGPDGGSAEKPVGTVWFGLATPDNVTTYHHIFPGNREEVRHAAVAFALALLQTAGEEGGGSKT
jgi:nicotinamide-nucleotide amidase